MLRRVVGQVWQEEEIAITMVQFQLWGSIIIIVEAELCHEETLQVALSLDTIPNR